MAAQVEQPIVYIGALDPEALGVVVTASAGAASADNVTNASNPAPEMRTVMVRPAS